MVLEYALDTLPFVLKQVMLLDANCTKRACIYRECFHPEFLLMAAGAFNHVV
jgi:hypothetical protein